jgi:hypothetical protein
MLAEIRDRNFDHALAVLFPLIPFAMLDDVDHTAVREPLRVVLREQVKIADDLTGTPTEVTLQGTGISLLQLDLGYEV